jgi:hypothetical protein
MTARDVSDTDCEKKSCRISFHVISHFTSFTFEDDFFKICCYLYALSPISLVVWHVRQYQVKVTTSCVVAQR